MAILDRQKKSVSGHLAGVSKFHALLIADGPRDPEPMEHGEKKKKPIVQQDGVDIIRRKNLHVSEKVND